MTRSIASRTFLRSGLASRDAQLEEFAISSSNTIASGLLEFGREGRSVVPSLHGVIAALLGPFGSGGDRGAQTAAIEVLRFEGTDPDMREWAERYLCGMTGAEPRRFTDRYPAQS